MRSAHGALGGDSLLCLAGDAAAVEGRPCDLLVGVPCTGLPAPGRPPLAGEPPDAVGLGVPFCFVLAMATRALCADYADGARQPAQFQRYSGLAA